MAEWWEPIVGVALVISTIGLVVATAFLAKYTKVMAKQTKATEDLTRASIKASEALQTMPSLAWDGAQPLSDGAGKYSRFSVKNVGYGLAKNPFIRVKPRDGSVVGVKPHTKTNMIETDSLYYWDVFDVKVGQELDIEISFTDIRDVPYPSFKHTYVVF